MQGELVLGGMLCTSLGGENWKLSLAGLPAAWWSTYTWRLSNSPAIFNIKIAFICLWSSEAQFFS
jgi:hypothetical protein